VRRKPVRVLAKPTVARPHRPETFSGEMVGAVFPPGSTFFKVTHRSREGPGEYLTGSRPPTVESARRRFVLPPESKIGEVRKYRAIAPVVATVGQIAGSTGGDDQAEIRDRDALEEVARWRLPFDGEVRFGHVLAGMAAGATAGLVLGYAIGNPVLGLVVGLLIGLVIGALFPTDWTELFNLLLGPSKSVFLFVL
jgi:hypothetical protein